MKRFSRQAVLFVFGEWDPWLEERQREAAGWPGEVAGFSGVLAPPCGALWKRTFPRSDEIAGPQSLGMSQDTEVRRRVVGAGPAQGEPSPPKKEQDHVLSPWKPLLVNMCMATVLTAGAYLCYRGKTPTL
ncbi:hypothetical protein MC885_011888 [Smutsia gigantea]|nr:hypothetical protein MC885_011888 [Smutsia gigantea]